MLESTLLINVWGLVEASECFLVDGRVEGTEDEPAVNVLKTGFCCEVEKTALEGAPRLKGGGLCAGNCFRDLSSGEIIILSARSRFGLRRGNGSSSDSDSLESSNISSSSVID